MGSEIKVISDHSETLGDGRERAPGETARGVDLADPVNKRLLEEGRILVLSEETEEERTRTREETRTRGDDTGGANAADDRKEGR